MDKKCLKCGYERKPSDLAPNYECPQCGAIYTKAKSAMSKERDSNSIQQDFANYVKFAACSR